MTAADLLDRAIALNADLLQVNDNLEFSSIDWTSLSSKAKSNRIELQVGNVGGPEDVILCAKIAGRVGSPIVRFVIGQAFVSQSVHEVADDFRDAARICMENGARLAIENHDFFTTKQLAEIVSLIGHGCSITLDTANSLATLEGTECIVNHLGPHVVCLHAKDIVLEREFHMLGFRVFGVPTGHGAVDFHYLRDNLPSLESVVLEQWTPPANNQPPLASEREAVEPGLNFLRGVWAS
ncbi:MAG: sugar phosphate isomerase/epimerase [Chlorobia bacterium]|nr:sugar phosphate isomerase/epimerase [Fimbriimonadaceae bacterium]